MDTLRSQLDRALGRVPVPPPPSERTKWTAVGVLALAAIAALMLEPAPHRPPPTPDITAVGAAEGPLPIGLAGPDLLWPTLEPSPSTSAPGVPTATASPTMPTTAPSVPSIPSQFHPIAPIGAYSTRAPSVARAGGSRTATSPRNPAASPAARTGSSSSASGPGSGPIFLRNAALGTCVTVSDPGQGSPARMLPCSGTTTRYAASVSGTGTGTGTGSVRSAVLTLVGTGQCVDVAYESQFNGTAVVSGSCTGHASQRWTLVAATDGTYSLVDGNSRMCLDIAYHSSAPGSPVVQGGCDNSAYQRWRLAPE